MDISSIGATAVVTQTAQREQVLSLNAVRQQNQAEQAIVAMLDQSAPNPAPSGNAGRGQNLNILV
jgi:hypothetical protein